jgi:hypothetical protein
VSEIPFSIDLLRRFLTSGQYEYMRDPTLSARIVIGIRDADALAARRTLQEVFA